MTLFFIILLTAILVVDCSVLTLLVLIQLPKKEAGIGVAFGAGATDALFGAGSGNVLTKITKYSAGIFVGLAIILSAMQSRYHDRIHNASDFTTPSVPAIPGVNTPAPGTAASTTAPGSALPAAIASNQTNRVAVESTNVPAPAPSTNR
jgi:preprotein translocase subunit SecG